METISFRIRAQSDVLEKDMESLGYLQKIDVQDSSGQLSEEQDSRRICGFPPITTMFHCMDAKTGAASFFLISHRWMTGTRS